MQQKKSLISAEKSKMLTNKCLICLSQRKTLINFNTTEWRKLQINFLIDKHLWPMEYDATSGVCKKCWQKLASFHEFFVDVQKLHKVLVLKNFNTIQNEEFQKVLKDICKDMKRQNVPQLENEILQHSNYIGALTTETFIEPKEVSEPIDDGDEVIDKNSKQFNSIESKTQDLEKNPLDLDLSMENRETEKVFKESDDNNKEYNVVNKDDSTKNIKKIESIYLENSLSDSIASLDPLTQTDVVDKSTERCKNTDRNLEEETINEDDYDDIYIENVFSDSGSWANDENETESDESSKELKNTTNKIDANEQTNCREDEFSDLEIGETLHDTQQNNKLNKTDAFIAKHLKLICSVCETPMGTFNELMKHFEKEHNTSGYVMCCDKKFIRRWMLYDHLILHDNPNHFKCSHCGEVFSSRGAFAIHNKNHHTEAFEKAKCKGKINKTDKFIAKHYKITCCLCEIPMKNFSELIQHFEKEHQNVKAYVMCCGKKILQRWHLFDHLITHTKPNYFQCSQCNEIFENRLRLASHVKIQHDDVNGKYQCNICNIQLKGGTQLTIHKAKHLTDDEKKYVCTHCGKKFALKHRLKVHTKIVHEQVNKKICEICGISYCSAHALEIHMLKRHMDKPAPTFACDICGLKLSSTSVLARHKKIRHSKDHQEYTCDVCSKVSVGLYAHKWHLTLHNRKYKCQICGKSFSKSKLRNHLATHSGEAPYKCSWCPKTFNYHGNFSTHRSQKHRKEWLEIKRSKYVDGKLPSDEDDK